MNIIIRKYKFNDTLPLSDINFFSGDRNYTLIDELDVTEYLKRDSLDSIETSIDSISDDNKLNFECSDVSFELSNIIPLPNRNDLFLSDFFQIYNSSVYDRYEIEFISSSGNKKYFISTSSNIKMNDVSRKELIKISGLSLEKEMSDYYSNQTIPKIPSEKALPNGPDLHNLYSSKFENVLKNIFFNKTSNYFNIQLIGLKDLYILHNAYFYYPVSNCINELFFAQCGYLNFTRLGCNLFQFVKSIVLSWGFIMYFSEKTLIIRNRYDTTSFPIKEIDFNTDVISFDLENNVSDKFAKHILINNGEFYDGFAELFTKEYDRTYYDPGVKEVQIGDKRKIVISDSNYTSNNFYPFDYVTFNSSSNRYGLGYSSGYEVMISRNDDNNYFRFDRETFNDSNKYEEDKFAYEKALSIEVNPAVNDRNTACMIDMNLARSDESNDNFGNGMFYTRTDLQPSGRTWAFTGNAGNCLMYYDSVLGKIFSYNDYIKTEQFSNNFKVLLKSKNQLIITIEINEIIEVPNFRFRLKNYPYPNNNNIENRIFCVQKMDTDYINETTKLTLVSMNNNI